MFKQELGDTKAYDLQTLIEKKSKLHKRPYKARFIANLSSCSTTELSKLLSSCLTVIRKHAIKYRVYERSGENLFWPIKIQIKL